MPSCTFRRCAVALTTGALPVTSHAMLMGSPHPSLDPSSAVSIVNARSLIIVHSNTNPSAVLVAGALRVPCCCADIDDDDDDDEAVFVVVVVDVVSVVDDDADDGEAVAVATGSTRDVTLGGDTAEPALRGEVPGDAFTGVILISGLAIRDIGTFVRTVRRLVPDTTRVGEPSSRSPSALLEGQDDDPQR